MLFGCKHMYVEQARRFTPPAPRLTKINSGYTQDETLEILSGFTTIELRCEHCGRLMHYRVPGDQRNAD